ncbi:MAG: hypothetical protein GXO83_10290, partial [Chlorobi bacterium]|nr:hypothetical protein [Chlorobiota bacterium]
LTTNDVTDAEDDAFVENVFDDAMDAADVAIMAVDNMIWGGGLKSAVVVADTCPVITVDHPDSTTWPKVITIDYGDLCTGFFGHTRSGKIVITITGRYRVPGSSRTVELVNYYINGVHVEGTRTVTNDGRNDNGNLEFSVSLKGGKVTFNDTMVITREYDHTREWVSGEDTRNHWDDVYFISGTATGTNLRGITYTRTITSPLEWAASCRFIKSGTVEIVFSNSTDTSSPIVLDFGDGTCDNEATITKDGETRTIELRYHPRPKAR